jgi:hypothetical protein
LRNPLSIAVVACAIIGQLHFLFNGDASWDVFVLGLMAEAFILSLLLYRKYDYADLKNKYMSFIMCMFPLIQGFLFIIKDPVKYAMAFGILVTCSVVWFLYAVMRPYSRESDPLDDEYVYKVAKRPNSFVTFLVAMGREAFGRYSYYHSGTVFFYQKDIFLQKEFDNYIKADEEYIIIRTNKRATPEVKDKLFKRCGSKWSLRNNCLTVLWHV